MHFARSPNRVPAWAERVEAWKLRVLAAMCCLAGVVLLSWSVRNYLEYQPIRQKTVAFLTGHLQQANALSGVDGKAVKISIDKIVKGDSRAQVTAVIATTGHWITTNLFLVQEEGRWQVQGVVDLEPHVETIESELRTAFQHRTDVEVQRY